MIKRIQKLHILFIVFFIINSIYASDTDRLKIGLVLSGGGAKGVAHIGTLKMLDSLQISVDYIAGTSMGGLLGGLYAIGYTADEIEEIILNTNWKEIFTDSPPRSKLPYFQKKDTGKYQLEFDLDGLTPIIPSGIIQGQKIRLFLSRLTLSHEGISDFDELPIPFRCVAVDLITANEVVMKSGSLAKAMRATMSIPSVFSPVEFGDSLLIDGGIINNLPVDVVKDMGADIIIAVNVGAPLKKYNELESVVDILEQSLNLSGYTREKENIKIVNVLISPQLENYGAGDFENKKIKEIIYLGDKAAKGSIDSLINLKQLYQSGTTTKEHPSNEANTNKTLIVHGISIIGNTNLPFQFINRLIDINPGDDFNPNLLEERITALYSLGYFKTVHYEIQRVTDKSVRLILHVKERPIRKMRIGLRYDNNYQLIAALSYQGTNVLFPGLRAEGELQFAGLTYFKYGVSYPSRSLNLPIYPFARIEYKDIPINIFDLEGNRIASYHDRSIKYGLGLGLLLSKFCTIETQYQYEDMDITPILGMPELFTSWKDRLRKLQLSIDFDILDDVLLPRHGIAIQGNYEGSFKRLGSSINYAYQEISADIYHTIFQKHTGHFYGYWGQGNGNLLPYKYLYKGGPDDFIGVEYNQLAADRLSVFRFDYRYEYKKDIFFNLIVNAALNFKYPHESILITNDILWGYGIGIKFLSLVGPIQFIYGRSSKSVYIDSEKRDKFYFTAGYKF